MAKQCKDEILKSPRTVFRLRDIAILCGDRNADNLKSKVNYHVSRGVLQNIRKGIYAKNPYSLNELACRVYSPSYISLETVLLRAGVIFQFSSAVTSVSYLSRTITLDGNELVYRKMKNSILVNDKGILRNDNISIATPERAFLDMLYLSKEYYFDNLAAIDRRKVMDLLSLYDCAALGKRARRLFRND